MEVAQLAVADAHHAGERRLVRDAVGVQQRVVQRGAVGPVGVDGPQLVGGHGRGDDELGEPRLARGHRGEDIGVDLTLNAEHDIVRWGPLTHAPSLLDGDGGFPRTLADLWDHADLDEVRRECRAQIERAIVWGFGITHLTSHLDALVLRPEFFDVYLDLACEFRLPVRLGGPDLEAAAGFPARSLAAEEGILLQVRSARAKRWKEENAEAIADYNRWIAENGIPNRGIRIV